jgi:Fe-S-cluster-containing hydrogenase component 2
MFLELNMSREEVVWIFRDLLRCSGCRRCELACSLHHEGKMWPEASRIRVFMLFPGAEVPHLCSQCHDYPCVASCPTKALSVDEKTLAVKVDREKCVSCAKCIDACPGKIPFLHPGDNKATICDLCDGDPECVKVCREGRFDALWLLRQRKEWMGKNLTRKLFAQRPEDLTRDIAENIFGEKAKELV